VALCQTLAVAMLIAAVAQPWLTLHTGRARALNGRSATGLGIRRRMV
jgi:hypothetical protein